MNKRPLPIALMHARCMKCHLPTEFQAFESGVGGEFATYVGLGTRSMYRVNLAKTQYLGASLDSLLASAQEREGSDGLQPVPEGTKCKFCGGDLETHTATIDSESVIEAYDL